MKGHFRQTAVSAALLIALGLSTSSLAAADSAKSATVWPAADIKWTDSPSIKGAKMAVLWGDPKAGAYAALKSLPAGTTLAVHTHTSEQRVIVLSGTISLSIDGAPAKDLSAGSYTHIPGGLKHTADCKAGADCVYFEEQPGASDIKFAAPSKK